MSLAALQAQKLNENSETDLPNEDMEEMQSCPQLNSTMDVLEDKPVKRKSREDATQSPVSRSPKVTPIQSSEFIATNPDQEEPMGPITPLLDQKNEDNTQPGVPDGKPRNSKKAPGAAKTLQKQQIYNQIILGEISKDFQVESSIPELINDEARSVSPMNKQIQNQKMWKTQKELKLKKTGKVAKYSREQSALRGSQVSSSNHDSSGYRDNDDQDNARRRATSQDPTPLDLDVRGQALITPNLKRKDNVTSSHANTDDHNVSTMIVIKTQMGMYQEHPGQQQRPENAENPEQSKESHAKSHPKQIVMQRSKNDGPFVKKSSTFAIQKKQQDEPFEDEIQGKSFVQTLRMPDNAPEQEIKEDDGSKEKEQSLATQNCNESSPREGTENKHYMTSEPTEKDLTKRQLALRVPSQKNEKEQSQSQQVIQEASEQDKKIFLKKPRLRAKNVQKKSSFAIRGSKSSILDTISTKRQARDPQAHIGQKQKAKLKQINSLKQKFTNSGQFSPIQRVKYSNQDLNYLLKPESKMDNYKTIKEKGKEGNYDQQFKEFSLIDKRKQILNLNTLLSDEQAEQAKAQKPDSHADQRQSALQDQQNQESTTFQGGQSLETSSQGKGSKAQQAPPKVDESPESHDGIPSGPIRLTPSPLDIEKTVITSSKQISNQDLQEELSKEEEDKKIPRMHVSPRQQVSLSKICLQQSTKPLPFTTFSNKATQDFNRFVPATIMRKMVKQSPKAKINQKLVKIKDTPQKESSELTEQQKMPSFRSFSPFLVKMQPSGYIAKSLLDPCSSNHRLSKAEWKSKMQFPPGIVIKKDQKGDAPNEKKVGSLRKTRGRSRRPNLAEAMNMQGEVSIEGRTKGKHGNTRSTKQRFRKAGGSRSSSSSRASLIDMNDMNVLQIGGSATSVPESKTVSCVVSRRVSNMNMKVIGPKVSGKINENSSDEGQNLKHQKTTKLINDEEESRVSRDSSIIESPTIPTMNTNFSNVMQQLQQKGDQLYKDAEEGNSPLQNTNLKQMLKVPQKDLLKSDKCFKGIFQAEVNTPYLQTKQIITPIKICKLPEGQTPQGRKLLPISAVTPIMRIEDSQNAFHVQAFRTQQSFNNYQASNTSFCQQSDSKRGIAGQYQPTPSNTSTVAFNQSQRLFPKLKRNSLQQSKQMNSTFQSNFQFQSMNKESKKDQLSSTHSAFRAKKSVQVEMAPNQDLLIKNFDENEKKINLQQKKQKVSFIKNSSPKYMQMLSSLPEHQPYCLKPLISKNLRGAITSVVTIPQQARQTVQIKLDNINKEARPPRAETKTTAPHLNSDQSQYFAQAFQVKCLNPDPQDQTLIKETPTGQHTNALSHYMDSSFRNKDLEQVQNTQDAIAAGSHDIEMEKMAEQKSFDMEEHSRNKKDLESTLYKSPSPYQTFTKGTFPAEDKTQFNKQSIQQTIKLKQASTHRKTEEGTFEKSPEKSLDIVSITNEEENEQSIEPYEKLPSINLGNQNEIRTNTRKSQAIENNSQRAHSLMMTDAMKDQNGFNEASKESQPSSQQSMKKTVLQKKQQRITKQTKKLKSYGIENGVRKQKHQVEQAHYATKSQYDIEAQIAQMNNTIQMQNAMNQTLDAFEHRFSSNQRGIDNVAKRFSRTPLNGVKIAAPPSPVFLQTPMVQLIQKNEGNETQRQLIDENGDLSFTQNFLIKQKPKEQVNLQPIQGRATLQTKMNCVNDHVQFPNYLSIVGNYDQAHRQYQTINHLQGLSHAPFLSAHGSPICLPSPQQRGSRSPAPMPLVRDVQAAAYQAASKIKCRMPIETRTSPPQVSLRIPRPPPQRNGVPNYKPRAPSPKLQAIKDQEARVNKNLQKLFITNEQLHEIIKMNFSRHGGKSKRVKKDIDTRNDQQYLRSLAYSLESETYFAQTPNDLTTKTTKKQPGDLPSYPGTVGLDEQSLLSPTFRNKLSREAPSFNAGNNYHLHIKSSEQSEDSFDDPTDSPTAAADKLRGHKFSNKQMTKSNKKVLKLQKILDANKDPMLVLNQDLNIDGDESPNQAVLSPIKKPMIKHQTARVHQESENTFDKHGRQAIQLRQPFVEQQKFYMTKSNGSKIGSPRRSNDGGSNKGKPTPKKVVGLKSPRNDSGFTLKGSQVSSDLHNLEIKNRLSVPFDQNQAQTTEQTNENQYELQGNLNSDSQNSNRPEQQHTSMQSSRSKRKVLLSQYARSGQNNSLMSMQEGEGHDAQQPVAETFTQLANANTTC